MKSGGWVQSMVTLTNKKASHSNTINWSCHFNIKEKTTPIIWAMSEILVISGSLLPDNTYVINLLQA